MTYEQEMEKFKNHLIDVLSLIEGGEDITTLVLNIRIEYDDWKEELANDRLAQAEDQQTREEDLADYQDATRL